MRTRVAGPGPLAGRRLGDGCHGGGRDIVCVHHKVVAASGRLGRLGRLLEPLLLLLALAPRELAAVGAHRRHADADARFFGGILCLALFLALFLALAFALAFLLALAVALADAHAVQERVVGKLGLGVVRLREHQPSGR